jgi:hypothetical protein
MNISHKLAFFHPFPTLHYFSSLSMMKLQGSCSWKAKYPFPVRHHERINFTSGAGDTRPKKIGLVPVQGCHVPMITLAFCLVVRVNNLTELLIGAARSAATNISQLQCLYASAS